MSPQKSKRIVRVNHHCHTCCSDGAATPNELLDQAVQKNMVLGLTDHNTIDGLLALYAEGLKDPVMMESMNRHLLPGVELQSENGIELLAYGRSIPHLSLFFRTYISPALSKKSSLYDPISIPILELCALLHEHGLFVIIPHCHLRSYGMCTLSDDNMQCCIAALGSSLIGIEVSPHLSSSKNIQAARLAKECGVSCLGGGDGHDHIHHRSYSDIAIDQSDGESAVDSVFRALRQNPLQYDSCHVELFSPLRFVCHASHMFLHCGFAGLRAMAEKKVQEQFSIRHKTMEYTPMPHLAHSQTSH